MDRGTAPRRGAGAVIDRDQLRTAVGALIWAPGELHCWQALPEGGRGGRPEVRSGPIAELLPWADRRSAEGGALYWTVQRTDGRGRRADHVVSVRALYVDLDGAPYPARWHLAPSLVVATSPGKWHAYWSIDAPASGWGAGYPMPLGEVEGAQRRLAALYGGDPSCIDLPRVLRLPGSTHRKAEPSPVVVSHADPWACYDWRDVLDGAPALPPTPPTPSRPAVLARAESVPGGVRMGLDLTRLDIVRLMADAGVLLDQRPLPTGGRAVVCPWAAEHTTETSPTAAVVWPSAAHGGSRDLPGFRCLHGHCAGRTVRDVLRHYSAHLGDYAPAEAAPHPSIARAMARREAIR